MLGPKIRSMRLFNGLKHPEVVDTILQAISSRQAALANLKRDGKETPEVTAAMAECLLQKRAARAGVFQVYANLVPVPFAR